MNEDFWAEDAPPARPGTWTPERRTDLARTVAWAAAFFVIGLAVLWACVLFWRTGYDVLRAIGL